jgi:hypothetical protein
LIPAVDLSVDPSRITPPSRAAHTAAYASDASLTAGFEWYRAFAQDARDNAAPAISPKKKHQLRSGD